MLKQVWLGVGCVVPLVIAAASGCQSGSADDQNSGSGGASSGGKNAAGEAGASSGGRAGVGGAGSASGGSHTGGQTPTGGSSPGGGMGGEAGAGTGGAGGTDCPALTGPGTAVSGVIDGQETWTTEGSPYVIDASIIVTGAVEIEACVAVMLAPGAGIEVRGSLTAVGRAELDADGNVVVFPVLFLPKEDGNPWGEITVASTGMLDLEVAGFEQGGSTGSVIRARGADQYSLPHRNVRTVGVGIYDSAGVAIEMTSRAGFTEDSQDVTIDSAGRADRPFPISIEAGVLESLPEPLTLENNDNDEIFVAISRQVHFDRVKSLGYPYHVDGAIYVYHENGVPQSEPSQLIIEAGVTMRMADNAGSGILVGSNVGYEAVLVAEGTADAPIRFESAEDTPAPGDWMGLYFRSPIIDGNSLRYVQVAHAGAESGTNGFGCGARDNDGSILLINGGPVAPFIESCTIEEAGGFNQIVLGWPDDPDPTGVASLVADSNTFDPAGPGCRVSIPGANTIPACPDLGGADACF